MKKQSFGKKAMQASAWYFRFATFMLSLVMGFSFALCPTTSSEALTVSQTAFGESLSDVDYKAVMNEPTAQNSSLGVSLTKAELKAKKLYPGGIPFGITRLAVFPIFGVNGLLATLIFSFFIGGAIGGIILIWRLLVALYYIPLTAVRFVATR